MKPYQGILAFISYFLLQLMVYFYISETYYTVIAGTIAVIVFAFMLYRKQMLHMSSRDLKGSQLLFCLGIGFGMSLFLKISILITVLSGEPIPELSVPDGFLWMATSVLLLPVVEELLVRGMLFGSFSRFISYPKAIVFSAAFFLFGHTKVSWPAVFVIGILLAWIYWRTDNLAVTMVIHGTTNFGSLLATPLYILLTTHRTIGVIVCLFVVFLGIGITYLCTKKFLQKHDALPA